MRVLVQWRIEGEVWVDAESADHAMLRVGGMTCIEVMEQSGIDVTDHFVDAVEATEA